MNDKSNRMNSILLFMIRSKIIDLGIFKYLLVEVLKSSVYKHQYLFLGRVKTPSMIWHGQNDMSKLKVFGCRV